MGILEVSRPIIRDITHDLWNLVHALYLGDLVALSGLKRDQVFISKTKVTVQCMD